MVLYNVLLNGMRMFPVVRTIVAGSACSGSIARILNIGVIGISKNCPYSTNSKRIAEGQLNPQSTNINSPIRPPVSPKITVMSGESSVVIMTLETAERMAKRRNLKLVKITEFDPKTRKPIYRMMTGAEYFEDEPNRRQQKVLKRQTEIKDFKLISLTTKIDDNDLKSKIKNIVKWLSKRHEVRVSVGILENIQTAENICASIENETKHLGKIQSKLQKGDSLKFQIMPVVEKIENRKPEGAAADTNLQETT